MAVRHRIDRFWYPPILTRSRQLDRWQGRRRNFRTHLSAVKVGRRLVQDDLTCLSVRDNFGPDYHYDTLARLNDGQVDDNGLTLNPSSTLGRPNLQWLQRRIKWIGKDDIPDLANGGIGDLEPE
jgi:hypothetical protein